MENLLWKIDNKTKTLSPTPFKSEDEFEKLVFETPEILEDIFLLKRQVRGSNKTGIPDIIGIDNNGNICIIEMKNVPVNSDIIPQVLNYAFWAENNPDSIKSLWLECKDKPDDLNITWDKFEVRILIIAPTIQKSTLDLVDKINYSVDLIEIKRWVDDKNNLLLVNKLEQEKENKKTKPVSGLINYDEEFYKKDHNPDAVKHFMKYTHDLEKYIKVNNWQLEMKYNKFYCGFKSGFFNAFSIKWLNMKTFILSAKITEVEASNLKPLLSKYDSLWKEAYYTIEPNKTKIEDYKEILEFAYKKLTGL